MEREQPWSSSSAVGGTISIATEFVLDFWRHLAPRQSDQLDVAAARLWIAPPHAIALVGTESSVPSVKNVYDCVNVVIVSLVLDIRLYATN
jgi:hypothetical protein